MSIPGSGSPLLLATTAAAAADAAYVIPKSLRFNSGDSSSLTKTYSSDGNRLTFTWSAWVKRSALGSAQLLFGRHTASSNAGFDALYFNASDKLVHSGWTSTYFTTTQVFRDPSAWLHIVWSVDVTQSAGSDRNKLYINGSLVNAYDTYNNLTQNTARPINEAALHKLGGRGDALNTTGYLADIQFVDGQALAPTDFGETRSSDGVWVPKEANITSPNDGTVWSSGTQTNPDTSRPLSNLFDGSVTTLIAAASGNNSSSKVTLPASVTAQTSVRYYSFGSGYNNGPTTLSNSGTTVSTIAAESNQASGWKSFTGTFPMTFNEFTINRSSDGTGSGAAAIEVDGVVLMDGAGAYGINGFHLNFSDSSTNEALGFDSAPTTPDPDPKKGMDVITYTGNGGTQNIGGLNFEPGLVWLKSRSESARSHSLYDNVRGASKVLKSDNTDTEVTMTGVTSFNPDGFTLGSHVNSNNNNVTYVAWTWRAGGPAVSNTDGTITSQVSANTDYGFSIVTYTGGTSDATIGHGLGQTPKFYIVKARESSGYTDSWNVYHTSLGESAYIKLQSNAAATTGSTIWNETAPTTALFSVDASSNANENNTDYVAYVWSEISGYSKFGTYEGASTVTVTTGFKPRWILLKNVDTSGSWSIFDSERDSDLEINHRIYANESSAEGTNTVIGNFTDTGFTLTNQGNSNWNTTGDTFVYAAFADRPGNNWDVNNIVTNEGLTTSKTQFDVVTYTGNGGTQAIGQPVYSDETTGGNNTSNMFDGSSSSWNNLTAGNTITFTPSRAIACTQLEIWVDTDTPIRVNVNGGGYGSTFTQSGLDYVDITPGGGITSLTSLLIDAPSGGGGSGAGIRGLRINGTTIVVDGDGGPGLKFQPDFVWIKRRDDSAKDHNLYDVVRGASGGYYKQLVSNVTSAENNNSSDYGRVTALNSDGFTVDSATSDHSLVNDNGDSYVAWCWKAGGTAVSNTDGDLTASVSANAAYGFSIIKFTTASDTSGGATVGHGLGTQPSLYIYKPTSTTGEWVVVSSHDYDQFAYLNATTEFRSISSNGGGTPADPTNSVLSLYDLGVTLASKTYICYAFANVPGYQRIGSYNGNGSSTGPVIVTGFKPRFLIIKQTDGTNGWFMWDTERDSTNPNDALFSANASNAEQSQANHSINFLNNGFQPDDSNGAFNGSGNSYIYIAIGDDEIGSDEDCLVDVPNAVTADADATDTTGGYQRGNYCTLNPVMDRHNIGSSGTRTFSEGNLKIVATTGDSTRSRYLFGTIGVSSGKWYYEMTADNTAGGIGVGFAPRQFADEVGSISVRYNSPGSIIIDGTTHSSLASFTSGDIIGVALNLDNSTVQFYKNGVAVGNSYSVTTGYTYLPLIVIPSTGTSSTGATFNFGQMRFKYPMPTGHSTINTTALPAATIPDGSAYFDTLLWTGDGASSTREITGLSMENAPDWIWAKERNGGSSYALFDAVRGFGTNNVLKSNSTDTAGVSNGGYINATSTSSITWAQGTSTAEFYDANNKTYVAWCWDAGSSTVTNTDGTGTCQLRANPSVGFSIATFTGVGVAKSYGHGLNAAPEMIIVKGINHSDGWSVYHSALGSTKSVALNQTSAAYTSSVWDNTAPNNTVTRVGGDYKNTGNTNLILSFTSVAGYSAFGEYIGNSSTDGPFIYTGFKVAWLMIKNVTDNGWSWNIYDTARDSTNANNKLLRPDYAANEISAYAIDFLSNGFKLRWSDGAINQTGKDYIYAAFAENPFQANGGLAR